MGVKSLPDGDEPHQPQKLGISKLNQRNYRWSFVIISVIGILNAVYLTILKFSNNKNLCIQGLGDCWSVNTSVYSQIYGIPIALLGGLAFLALLVLYLCENKLGFLANFGKYFIFGISLVGVLYSGYLTYLEIAVIQAICPFCVLSAISMLAIFIMSIYRLAKNPEEINR